MNITGCPTGPKKVICNALDASLSRIYAADGEEKSKVKKWT
jgi:hypothetical protein